MSLKKRLIDFQESTWIFKKTGTDAVTAQM